MPTYTNSAMRDYIVFVYNRPMSRWIEYNPNPRLRRTIDCAVRAVAGALLGISTAQYNKQEPPNFEGK